LATIVDTVYSVHVDTRSRTRVSPESIGVSGPVSLFCVLGEIPRMVRIAQIALPAWVYAGVDPERRRLWIAAPSKKYAANFAASPYAWRRICLPMKTVRPFTRAVTSSVSQAHMIILRPSAPPIKFKLG
jgi:hypothetical protein